MQKKNVVFYIEYFFEIISKRDKKKINRNHCQSHFYNEQRKLNFEYQNSY